MTIFGEQFDGKNVVSASGFVIRAEDRRISDKLSILEVALATSTKIPSYIPRGLIDAYGESVQEQFDKGKTHYTDAIVEVPLKFSEREAWLGKISKGDRIKVIGSVITRNYKKADGTQGSSLEFSFVNSVEVLSKGDGQSSGDSWSSSSSDEPGW